MSRIDEIIEESQATACDKINEEIFRTLLKKAFEETPDAAILFQEMGLTVLQMSDGREFFHDEYPEDAPYAFRKLMYLISITPFPYCYVTCPVPNDPWMPLTRDNVLKYF